MPSKDCLVVDDSRVIRNVARVMLEEMGFEVREAADGSQAMDECAAIMPEVILLDWNMPVMNGIDFVKELRRKPDGQDPIVIFCTTENDINSVNLAISAGANEYIMKPFDSEILRSKFEYIGLTEAR